MDVFHPLSALVSRTVKGEDEAVALAAKLVKDSTPFTVEPYPDDEWRFTAKEGRL